MLLSRACLTALFSAALLAAAGAPVAYASHIHRPPTSGTAHRKSISTHHFRSRRHHYYSHRPRVRGQQAIQPERVTEIQQALIRVHYMSGDPTGKWDSSTIAAMQKFQADHGWQTKIMPDARALVKLGLGEDYSNAINAKNLSLSTPPGGAAIPPDQEAGFEAASGASQ
jgi:peptidoglycan hydrolase-like protein with peptidoglycan-binding domain